MSKVDKGIESKRRDEMRHEETGEKDENKTGRKVLVVADGKEQTI